MFYMIFFKFDAKGVLGWPRTSILLRESDSFCKKRTKMTFQTRKIMKNKSWTHVVDKRLQRNGVFELLTSLHNVYNLFCCLIFMLRFFNCFCSLRANTKRNTENAPKCVRKGTKKTPKGPSAVAAATHGGPKWPPEAPKSPSETQMEPPSASLAALWAAPGGPKGRQGGPREHPKPTRKPPKSLIFLEFLMGFARLCFLDATPAQTEGKETPRKCKNVLPRGRKTRVSPTCFVGDILVREIFKIIKGM